MHNGEPEEENIQMPDTLPSLVAALSARFDDLVERIAAMQSNITQLNIQTTSMISEVRMISSRFDRLNGSVAAAIDRVTKIEVKCQTHDDDSASRKLDHETLDKIQVERVAEKAEAAGKNAVWAALRPWTDRAILSLLLALIVLLLVNTNTLLRAWGWIK